VPTYDYRCTVCGREVEVVHGIHEPGPSTCEACGGSMRKALSSPAIHFRGGGWAKKDAQAARSSTASGSSGKSGSAATEKPDGDGSSTPDAPAKSGDGEASKGGATTPASGTRPATTTSTTRSSG
jgi:putative FmdB family regulatory protein